MSKAGISDLNVRQWGPTHFGYVGALAVLVICGFYLRIRCLGCLGFRWDEDLTSLAVKSLMDDGVPDLPSGMVYTRFYPYQFLLAASAKVFGFSEFSIRLPGVILSTILIPVGYWITSRMFDRRIALIVAAGLALSFEQVEMARTARMYAPFFLAYTLAAYSIFNVYYKDTDRIFSLWPVLLSLLALSFHQLGYSLAVILAGAVFLNPHLKRTFSLVLQAAVIGIAFLATKSIQEHFFYLGQRMAQAGDSTTPLQQNGPTLLDSILSQIDIPSFDLFAQLAMAAPVRTFLIVSIGVASALWIASKSNGQNRWSILFALSAIALSVLQQFNLALVMLAALVVSSSEGLRSLAGGTWIRAACASGVLFLAWVLMIFSVTTVGPADIPLAEAGTRKMLRALVDYPNFRLFWSYALERPLLALPLALGTIWALDCIARRHDRSVALFLLCVFWAPLFLNGVIDTKYEFFRYNLHLDLFFLILCCAGLFHLPAMWNALRGVTGARPATPIPTGLWVLTAILVTVSVNPPAAAMTSSRGYHETGYWYRLFDLDRYQDFVSPAEYVRQRLRAEDRIFVLEPREYWNYIGRVDYWIMSDGYQSQTFRADGADLDLYLAIPVLHSLDQVKQAFQEDSTGGIWLLFSDRDLDTTPWISDEIKTFLTDLRGNTAYLGRDGQTRVVYLAPDHPERSFQQR